MANDGGDICHLDAQRKTNSQKIARARIEFHRSLRCSDKRRDNSVRNRNPRIEKEGNKD